MYSRKKLLTNVRSDWGSCLVATILVLLVSCITYKPQRAVIPKGARLHTYCGYAESNNHYDVTGIYVKNAKVESFLYKDEFTGTGHIRKYDRIVFRLFEGESIVLLVWGTYDPRPFTTAHSYEEFRLFIELDSIVAGDSLFLKKNGIPTIFYFNRFYGMLKHTGYTRDLDGHLFIDSIRDDIISGTIDFTAETRGRYYSYHPGQSTRDTTGSWVKCEIKFRAKLEQLKEDSVLVGSVILNWNSKNESND